MSHTPGPWTVEPIDERSARDLHIQHPAVWIVGGHDEVVATVEQVSRDQVLADASLIAAAPDLLKALKERPHDISCHPSEGRHTDACLRARAAIAKAEGRTA